MKLNKSISFVVDTAQRVASIEDYDRLNEIWNENKELRWLLVEQKVATKKDGVIKRKDISFDTALNILESIDKIDIVTPSYEIGYVK